MKYIEDILIIGGAAVIIAATFLWSFAGGLYVLGGCLVGLGIFFTKYPLKKRSD